MAHDTYRYVFQANVPLEEVESSMLLALMATESLHGETQVRLDASHYLDSDRRACVIDASTTVGRDLNRLFLGFLNREFGPDSFQVQHVDTPNHSATLQEVS